MLRLALDLPLADLVVGTAAVAPWPADVAELRHLAVAGIPAGARVEVGEPAHGRSELGWPIARIEARVLDDAGEVRQTRLCVVYRFFEHACVAAAVGAPDVVSGRREELYAALGRGCPDWGCDVVSQAHVWSGLDVEEDSHG